MPRRSQRALAKARWLSWPSGRTMARLLAWSSIRPPRIGSAIRQRASIAGRAIGWVPATSVRRSPSNAQPAIEM